MPFPKTDDLTPPEETDEVSSDRRIWKPRDAAHGSSLLSLKAFAVLYDAGRPLTKHELAAQMRPRLDPYEIGYLEAWHLRRQRQQRHLMRQRQKTLRSLKTDSELTTSIDRALTNWLGSLFCMRAHRHGQTLVRDADGRYAPGPNPPRLQTLEGQLVPFTPTARHALEQADRDAGHTHLALLDWTTLSADQTFASASARAQLLRFLLRRFCVDSKSLDERHLTSRFAHLLRLADTPAVRRAVLERVFHDFLTFLR